MLYVLNRAFETKGVLSNDAPNGNHFFNDEHTENVKENFNTLRFEVSATSEIAEHIETDGYIIYTDLDGVRDLFIIKETNYIKGDVQKIEVECEHGATSDLIGNIIRPQLFSGYNLQQIINVILDGTDWQLKTVVPSTVRDIEFKDFTTSLEALNYVLELFDCEVYFSVSLIGSNIVGKYLNVTTRRGQQTNKIFEYRKNLDKVERNEESRDLVTGLIGVGKDNLTLDGYLVTPPDPYVLEADYLYNADALRRYSRNGKQILGVFEDRSTDQVGVLYERTLEKLKELSKPNVEYSCDVITLEKLTGYEHESVRIGDTILVKDFSVTPEIILQARVVELRRSITDPTKDRVILGDYVNLNVNKGYDLHKIKQEILKVETITTENTSSIVTNTTAIQQNSTDISLKANQSEVDLIDGRLTDAEAEISINANNILLKASQSEVDSLSNTVSSNSSQISLNADNIALKVSETDYNGVTIASKINLDASSITISAEAIDLDGIVSVNQSLSVGSSSSDGTIYLHGSDGWSEVSLTGMNDAFGDDVLEIIADRFIASSTDYFRLGSITIDTRYGDDRIEGDLELVGDIVVSMSNVSTAFKVEGNMDVGVYGYTKTTNFGVSNGVCNVKFNDEAEFNGSMDVNCKINAYGELMDIGAIHMGDGMTSIPSGTNGLLWFGTGYAGSGLYLYDNGWRFIGGSG